MTPISQKSNSAVSTQNDFIEQIKKLFSEMSQKDKLAYSLIALGVILIIVGIILW